MAAMVVEWRVIQTPPQKKKLFISGETIGIFILCISVILFFINKYYFFRFKSSVLKGRVKGEDGGLGAEGAGVGSNNININPKQIIKPRHLTGRTFDGMCKKSALTSSTAEGGGVVGGREKILLFMIALSLV